MRFLLILLLVIPSLAQPADTGRFPAAGIAVPEATREDLNHHLQNLQTALASLRNKSHSAEEIALLADAEVYEKAVRYALEHNEFYRTSEFKIAHALCEEGLERVRALNNGESPWTAKNGPVVRAYRSRVDHSIQPFGLVIPEGYRPSDGKRYRLDIWLHGRDEKLTELKFIHDRSINPGEFVPPDTFVLHPYGRYCNAFKFAGETDVLEAIAAVERQYPIDDSRVVLRGFSMGGAGAWHLAVHHADRWICATPGAGFAESAEYLHLNPDRIAPYERALWQWYDATDYALNLFQCPLVAYTGELDKQRQSADVMAAALAREGLPMIHLIGPKTGHKYEPETKRVLSSIVDTFARFPRPETPREIRFTTRTLRYPSMHWLRLLGLEHHWQRADAWARLNPPRVTLNVTNVTAFSLNFRLNAGRRISEVEINGQTVTIRRDLETTNVFTFAKQDETWSFKPLSDTNAHLTKRPGLQGPIDDAFVDSFIFVTPSGIPFHAETGAWVDKELARAKTEWRSQFRGDARVVKDVDVTESDIANANLVLWGDPQSNSILGKILERLPIKWTAESLQTGKTSVDGRTHLPLMIYPNPLQPDKYIVLNSCFTFRGYGSNANQTPKLPDYAVLDVSQPDPFKTGVVNAGFFNESWAFESSPPEAKGQ